MAIMRFLGGLSEPNFMSNSSMRRIVVSTEFSERFNKIVSGCKKVGQNMNVV